MTNIELVLNMLAEVTTTSISRTEQPETFKENREIARRGGSMAKNARIDYERETNRKVISPINAKNKKLLDAKSQKESIENDKT